MNRIVLVQSGNAQLLLSNIVRNDGGTIRGAWVENGAWQLEIRRGRMFAQRYPKDDIGGIDDYEVFPVPADWRGDYNEIMQRAEAVFRNNLS